MSLGTVLLLGCSRGERDDPLLSTALRLLEVYGGDALILAGSDASSLERMAREVGGWIEAFTGRSVEVRTELLPHHGFGGPGGGGEPAVARLRRLMGSLAAEGLLVASPTAASRRLAAEMGLAAGGVAVRVNPAGGLESGPKPPLSPGAGLAFAYVDFCWGPWMGLPYPFVPRPCVPLVEVEMGRGEGPPGHVSTRLRAGAVVAPPGLGPLREAVALLSLRLNASTVFSAASLEPDQPRGCGWLRLRVEAVEAGGGAVELGEAVVEDMCRPADWVEAARRLRRILAERLTDVLAHSGGRLAERLRQLPALLGLEKLALPEGRLILDTSTVFRGVHLHAYSARQGRLVLPQCAVAELNRRYAEDAKQRNPLGQRLLSTLAYMALQELRSTGVAIAPSPSRDCDTAVPDMPPLLLVDSKPVTLDRGAYRYWTEHAALTRLAEPILAETRGLGDEDAAYAMYGLLQAAAALRLAEAIARPGETAVRPVLTVEAHEGGRRVGVPQPRVSG